MRQNRFGKVVKTKNAKGHEKYKQPKTSISGIPLQKQNNHGNPLATQHLRRVIFFLV